MKHIPMKPSIVLLSVLFSVYALSSCQAGNVVTSPDKNIQIHIYQPADQSYKGLFFSVAYRGMTVLSDSKLGLTTDLRDWSGNLEIVSASPVKEVRDDYIMITGKRSHCVNTANEKVFTVHNGNGQPLIITFRAYNDGVTFRYTIPDATSGESVVSEQTAYRIPEGTRRWIQTYEPAGYEAFYPLTTDGKAQGRWRPKNDWGYPVLVEPSDSVFFLITEADIQRGHCGSYLSNADSSSLYRVIPADEKLPMRTETDLSDNEAIWNSPWRVLIIGGLDAIVESTLVTDVSEPSTIEDTDWIKPGLVSWIYWANNHGSSDYKIVTEYMDLAVEMGWPYDLIDAEWDEMKNGGDIEDALAYAAAKGVKPMIWYNSSTNWVGNGAPTPYYRLNKPEDREKEYTWLNQQGVYGIKVDFFRGDKSEDMDYYIDLTEDAAKHHLMINFHGATLPRGWQRTYPNLMTVEGVYGAEWYNNAPILTNKAACHNATLPFTRNVVGSMDYTPGTFSDSQHPHITTHGHELALTVLFESALQHMPDRPSAYLSLPQDVRGFLSILPTAWDDTRLLAGYPGEEVVIARRKGDVWYIAGINGKDEQQTLKFSVSGLEGLRSNVWIAKDGLSDREFDISSSATGNTDYSIDCLPRGGFVMKIN